MRKDPEDVLEQAAAWHDAGRGVALATVVSTWGSSPRPAGSQLAAADDGSFVGSVSGGCVEAAVVTAARDVIRTGTPRLLEFGVTDETAWQVGLACGGHIAVYVARPDRQALAGLLSDRAACRTVVVATRLADGSQETIHPWDDAPGAEGALLDAAQRAAREDRSQDWEGTFLQVHARPVRLVVVGAVHVAQHLATLAEHMGFEVVIVDPRRAFATAERFPGVTLRTEWPDVAFEALAPDRRTAIVALTHDPKIDDPALTQALRSTAFYIGALGSKRTHEKRLERLRAAGFTDAELARIHGPIGLDIGARSTAEIAVAVLAQVIAVLRGRAQNHPWD